MNNINSKRIVQLLNRNIMKIWRGKGGYKIKKTKKKDIEILKIYLNFIFYHPDYY